MVLEAMLMHPSDSHGDYMDKFGLLLFTDLFGLLRQPFVGEVVHTHCLGDFFSNNVGMDDASGESVISSGNQLGNTDTPPGKLFQIFVFSADHGLTHEGAPEGPAPDLFKEIVPVQFEVEDPGFAFVGNLDTFDNVLLLLAISTDNVTQLATEHPLNSVEIHCLKQFPVVGIDDNTMGIESAQTFWSGSLL